MRASHVPRRVRWVAGERRGEAPRHPDGQTFRVYSVHHRQQAQRPPVVLLQAGVDLYELRPDRNMTRRWSTMAEKSTAALHAKGMVFDRQSVWIGSFNLDPRSIGSIPRSE